VSAAPDGHWSIERRTDTARALHAPWPAPDERGRRVVGLCRLVGPMALVLGSTQDGAAVDTAGANRQGVEVVRRSSGGGAVLVAPDAQVWLDVWLPRHDALWDVDILRSSWWLGETWTRALESLGARELFVHHGRTQRSELSDVVCFSGLGPGEVTARRAKLVGVSQRRSREGARWHSMAVLSWEPSQLLALLALDSSHAGGPLDDVATGVRAVVQSLRDVDGDVAITAVEDALLAALP
jgi:lipoate-protein ligase A